MEEQFTVVQPPLSILTCSIRESPPSVRSKLDSTYNTNVTAESGCSLTTEGDQTRINTTLSTIPDNRGFVE